MQLHVNPAATVDVTLHGATGMVQLLSTHVSRSTPLLAARISFSFATSRPSVTVSGYKSANPFRGSDPPVSLSLSTWWRPGSARQAPLTALLKAASTSKLFSSVQTLRVFTHGANSNLKYYAIDWLGLFLRMPALETLDVAGQPDKGFFKALSGCDTQEQANSTTARRQSSASAPAPVVTPDDSTGVPLVRLRELRLEGASFHNRDTGRRDRKRKNGAGAGERELVDELVEWAALRRDHGIPLWKLQLRRCDNVTEKDAGRARKVVREVDWERWEWKAAVGPPKWVDRDDYKYGGWF